MKNFLVLSIASFIVSFVFALYLYSSLFINFTVAEVTDTDVTASHTFDLSEMCLIDSECNLIAEAIVWEARGEKLEGQYAVASVIINRVNHPNFPEDIKSVINQRHQFSYIKDKHTQTSPEESDWENAYRVAYDVMYNGNITTPALFYLNPTKVERLPRWAREFTMISSIGSHDFYTY